MCALGVCHPKLELQLFLTFEFKYDLFRRFCIRRIGIQQEGWDEKDVSAK